ncbi:hypothetical protein CFP56_019866 [Quercus suber]|uniref:Uncharacterized protein n=1 Tax=Quercus suber TaxID=58331 RepID=A0AAW0KHQ7_QUESU
MMIFMHLTNRKSCSLAYKEVRLLPTFGGLTGNCGMVKLSISKCVRFSQAKAVEIMTNVCETIKLVEKPLARVHHEIFSFNMVYRRVCRRYKSDSVFRRSD